MRYGGSVFSFRFFNYKINFGLLIWTLFLPDSSIHFTWPCLQGDQPYPGQIMETASFFIDFMCTLFGL
jgi:hypothetical protein